MVKVNGVFKRRERKVKAVRILNLYAEEEVHLCEGTGAEDDLAQDEGGFLQNPAETGREKDRTDEQKQYAVMRPEALLAHYRYSLPEEDEI